MDNWTYLNNTNSWWGLYFLPRKTLLKMTVWKELKECKFQCVTYIDFDTHQHGIIDLFICIDSLANRLFTYPLHLLPPLPFISLSILLFLSLPLHHNHRCSSSSSVYLFIVICIPLHHRHRYSLPIFCLLFHPLFIHLLILKNTFLVGCLQSEQNIYQKSHFSCAIVKFA